MAKPTKPVKPAKSTIKIQYSLGGKPANPAKSRFSESSMDQSISLKDAVEKLDKTFEENYALSSEFQSSRDIVRDSMDNYWTDKASDIRYSSPPYTSYVEITEEEALVAKLSDFVTYYSAQTVKFSFNNGTIVDPSEMSSGAATAATLGTSLSSQRSFSLRQALNSLSTTEDPIEFYAYNCNKPIEYSSRNDNSLKPNTPTVEVSYVYNYGSPNYEQLISDQSVKESSLLNYYSDYSELKNINIANKKYESAAASSPASPTLLNKSTQGTSDEVDNKLSTKTREKTSIDQNIIIPPIAMAAVTAKTKDLLTLPFYIKIEIGKSFSTPYASELSSLESLSKELSPEIMKYSLDITSAGANTNYFKKRDFNYSYFDAQYRNENQTEYDLTKNISSESIFLIDALDLSQNIDDDSVIVNSSNPKATILAPMTLSPVGPKRDGIRSSTMRPPPYSSEDFRNNIRSLLGPSGPLHNTYLDIINGQAELYSTNILFYKISKFEDSNLETPIQNIFIPNDGKNQTYIDFQVKYGKRYVYKIYAYKFISGTEYNLSKTMDLTHSAFLTEIVEYKNKRDEIEATASYKRASGTGTYTVTYSFAESLEELSQDLIDVVNSEGKNKISHRKESMDSTHRESFGLRIAIAALQSFNLAESSAESYLETTLRTVIYGKDINLVPEIKERLTIAYNSISSFAEEGEKLQSKLLKILHSEHGFGNTKKSREAEARSYIEQIREFQAMEEEILNILSEIKSYQIDSESDYIQENEKYVTAILYPKVELAEVPYYQNAGAILDAPPVFPDINFIPYRGNSRSISLFMNSGIGNVLESPIMFTEQEMSYYSLYRESKKLNNVEPIEFVSDDTQNMASSFEIYRVPNPPSNYDDYRDITPKTISEKFKGGASALSSASYLDKLKPNKTYYYMFRQRDLHGVLSNPSAVFSVMLVDDGGIVFPLIEQYDFPKKIHDYNRPVRKLISISPSIDRITPQGLPGDKSYTSYTPESSINTLVGLQGSGIFGKTFKMRITSKKTGRQIDLNITFEAEVV
jgi:hypothetical protein